MTYWVRDTILLYHIIMIASLAFRRMNTHLDGWIKYTICSAERYMVTSTMSETVILTKWANDISTHLSWVIKLFACWAFDTSEVNYIQDISVRTFMTKSIFRVIKISLRTYDFLAFICLRIICGFWRTCLTFICL